MPNVALVLKEEMARVARKELRSQTGDLRKAVAKHRSELAAVKKELAAVSRQLKVLQRHAKARVSPARTADQTDDGGKLRFRAAGFATLRAKLDLSAREMAKLLGVSQISVYKWEHGKAKPRAKQLAAIAAVRGLGKRDARARLDAMG